MGTLVLDFGLEDWRIGGVDVQLALACLLSSG